MNKAIPWWVFFIIAGVGVGIACITYYVRYYTYYPIDSLPSSILLVGQVIEWISPICLILGIISGFSLLFKKEK